MTAETDTRVPISVAAKQVPMHLRDLQRWISKGVVPSNLNERGWHMFSPGDIARLRAIRELTLRRVPLELCAQMIDGNSGMTAAFAVLRGATITTEKNQVRLCVPAGDRDLSVKFSSSGEIVRVQNRKMAMGATPR